MAQLLLPILVVAVLLLVPVARVNGTGPTVTLLRGKVSYEASRKYDEVDVEAQWIKPGVTTVVAVRRFYQKLHKIDLNNIFIADGSKKVLPDGEKLQEAVYYLFVLEGADKSPADYLHD